MKRIVGSLLVAMIIIVGCSKGGSMATSTTTSVDCAGDAKTFGADANPVIQATCAISSGCHAAGSINGPGPLTSYQQIFNARAAIRSAVISGSMPQGSSLSSSQKSEIICWIDNGASNN